MTQAPLQHVNTREGRKKEENDLGLRPLHFKKKDIETFKQTNKQTQAKEHRLH